ncbi:MAG: iron-sulfur cluster assembly scaffold protein [Candidatus Bathyarchaeota archaeon]
MSRTPLPYSPKIIELFRNPLNLGKMEDATVMAVAGSPACGDMIALYLKINKDDVIEKASFESYGCASNIATASITTEIVKGQQLQDAWQLSWMEVAEAVGGLPKVKFHCGILSIGALRRAIREYYKTNKKPTWLPEELTIEEKHALDEEELSQVLSKKIGGQSEK